MQGREGQRLLEIKTIVQAKAKGLFEMRKNVSKEVVAIAALVVISIFSYLFFSPVPDGSKFSIIVLPDTQKYSKDFPLVFSAQTQWIADNADGLNIVFVSQEGDIVDNWDSTEQWENADAAMRLLDGKVPYAVLPGNHDFSKQGDSSNYNKYFPVSRFDSFAWYGGSHPPGENDNSFQLFSASGIDFIALHLKYCPSADTIEWANNVLRTHSERRAIIVTHAYLGLDAEREVHSYNESNCGTGSNNTQYIWDELVYPNENVFLFLCGHVHGETRRVDKNAAGKPVYQLLADYQSGENGGNGWLRILEFSPAQNKIFVKTFSPYLNEFETDYDSQFELPLEAS